MLSLINKGQPLLNERNIIAVFASMDSCGRYGAEIPPFIDDMTHGSAIRYCEAFLLQNSNRFYEKKQLLLTVGDQEQLLLKLLCGYDF